MFWVVIICVCVVAGIVALYLWLHWEDTFGKTRAMYKASMPKESYVEATFDNWLDWFMIAPDK